MRDSDYTVFHRVVQTLLNNLLLGILDWLACVIRKFSACVESRSVSYLNDTVCILIGLLNINYYIVWVGYINVDIILIAFLRSIVWPVDIAVRCNEAVETGLFTVCFMGTSYVSTVRPA